MNHNMMPGEVSIHNNLMFGQRPGYGPAMMQPVNQNVMMYGSGMGMLTTPDHMYPDQDVHIFIESCKVKLIMLSKQKWL